MHINNIIFCDTAQDIVRPDGSKVTVLFNPSPALSLPFIPGLYSFMVSAGISDLPESYRGIATFQLYAPDNSIVSSTDLPIDMEGIFTSITCNVDMRNVLLTVEGVYTAKVQIEDQFSTSSIIVRKK